MTKYLDVRPIEAFQFGREGLPDWALGYLSQGQLRAEGETLFLHTSRNDQYPPVRVFPGDWVLRKMSKLSKMTDKHFRKSYTKLLEQET